MSARLSYLFPLFAILASALALWQPQLFNNFGSWIIPILMIIMFCMGLTLSFEDFARVLNLKSVVVLGVALQYLVMPLTAFLVSIMLGLPKELSIGMILVGSASGGTASNVICYLARADVALSISLTLVSTLLAVVAMPALTWFYAGAIVPVPVLGMLLSVTKIVLVPVIAGLIINQYLRRLVEPIKFVLPTLTTSAIVLVIAIIVALNEQKLATVSMVLIAAVVMHNLVGLLAGYYAARLMRQNGSVCRTLAIEVGMQNSGLAVALAIKYFSALAALPGAVFSIWHNLTGSLLAAFWKSRSTQ